MALIVTSAGGLALLGGVAVVGHVVGSFDLDTVLASGAVLRAHPLYPAALVLILVGAFTKSAQFPFHFWLPRAMAAPTPVSAYLHSATMVKAGVFLLARLWPVLSGTELWFWLVGGAGLTTLLLGAYIAMFQHDLKRVLAYSTISHLGLITLLFGLNSPLAAVAGVFHIMNHATFKASLFMAAGIVDHKNGHARNPAPERPFSAPFLMSLVAITGGIAGYVWLRRQQRRGRFENPPLTERFNGRRLFESALVGLTRLSRATLRRVGTARLQPQLFAVLAVALLLALLSSRGEPFTWGDRDRLPPSPVLVLLWVLGIVCAVAAAVKAKYHRLVALTLMGGAVLITCLTFAWFSAPDLALTQLVVEVVTTMLFLLGLRWLPVAKRW